MLQNSIKTAAARRYHEDKWICKLKIFGPHGFNTEICNYAKEMYNLYYFHKKMKYMTEFGMNQKNLSDFPNVTV